MRKILITGATGFIGGNLAHRLAGAGRKIRCLVRKSSPQSAIGFLEELGEVVWGDLLDAASLAPAVKDVSLVFHAGGGGRFGMDASLAHRINCTATENLLDACLGSSRIERFVHFSTCAVMGHIDKPPADETWPYKAEKIAYAQAKTATEKLVLDYADRLGVVVVRLPAVYGAPVVELEPDRIGGVIPFLAIIKEIKNGTWMHIGDGRNLIHCLHTDNAVGGLMRAAESGRPGEVYILADRQALTMREMAALTAKALGAPEPRGWLPVPVAHAAGLYYELKSGLFGGEPRLNREMVAGLAAVRSYDTAKAESHLGYEPKTTFAEGIKSAVDWYAERGYT